MFSSRKNNLTCYHRKNDDIIKFIQKYYTYKAGEILIKLRDAIESRICPAGFFYKTAKHSSKFIYRADLPKIIVENSLSLFTMEFFPYIWSQTAGKRRVKEEN